MKSEFKILTGNCLNTLKTLPDKSIATCVTSPPYYALRDYGTGKWVGGNPDCPHYRTNKVSKDTATGHKKMMETGHAVGDAIYKNVCPLCGAVRVDEQVGLEETPEQYIDKLVEVFREVKRVLKDDGTLWVNIGDSYASNQHSNHNFNYAEGRGSNNNNIGVTNTIKDDVKEKDLIGIPWKLAFALRKDGWYLRQDIIWCLAQGTELIARIDGEEKIVSVLELSKLKNKKIKVKNPHIGFRWKHNCELWDGKKWVTVSSVTQNNFFKYAVKIHLGNGTFIDCTDGHRLILSNGEYIRASDIKVGDVLKHSTFPDGKEPMSDSDATVTKIGKGVSYGYFDIEVDSEEHEFMLANGVISHNCKTNPMPESVTDRCTKSHEYIFLLSKNPSYYFDYKAVQEEAESQNSSDSLIMGGKKYSTSTDMFGDGKSSGIYSGKVWNPQTDDVGTVLRNKRDVWTVGVNSFRGAHFATFPEKLIEPCILAGSKEGDTVLDPFNGSGTTGIVSLKHGRNYIGCELNEEYVKMSEERLNECVGIHAVSSVGSEEKIIVEEEDLF